MEARLMQARRDDADGVITVTFTRDEKLNAVSPGMMDLLRHAAADLAERDDLRVLVITAAGRYFTAGLDIETLQQQHWESEDGIVRGSNVRRRYRSQADHDFFDELESIEKPVVLAAQGPCLGVGVELGSSCDFRLASDTAVFGLPEVANLAVIPGSGGISRLTRLVGSHWAKWLAMACQTVDAREALAMGLVHAVYPAAEFGQRVQEFARHLAGLPGEAVGLAKLAIDTAASVDRRSARDVDRLAQSALFTSAEYLDRLEAFNLRRQSSEG
jgi:enoyl-CoA hydratase/carnithine racemase